MTLFRSRSLASLAAVSAGVVAVTLPAAADARPAARKTTVVKVVAGRPSEFRFTLSRTRVKAGRVEFKIRNKGKLSHTFSIAGRTTKAIAHGRSARLRVKLKKGTYRYKCTVPHHAAMGMKGVLRVT
jgi:plastocyanin